MGKRITRRKFLSVATTVSYAAYCQAKSKTLHGKIELFPEKRPNILFIMADDLSNRSVGCYNPLPDFKTPAIDSIRDGGFLLKHAYSAQCFCSPTRAALMMGKYPQKFEAGRYSTLNPNSNIGLPKSEPTLASLLKENGYRTALIGKWHLGAVPEHGPLKYGYEYFYGISTGMIDYFNHKGADGRHDLFENAAPIYDKGYATDLFTNRALDFLSKSSEQPFFLSLHYNAPHSPLETHEDLKISEKLWEDLKDVPADKRQSEMLRVGSRLKFIKVVKRMDEGIGKILKLLSEKNLRQNTIIFFTADNGGGAFSGEGWFKGAKGSLYEGGIRVPGLIYWPGLTTENKSIEEPIYTMDFTATILSAANVKYDKNKFDGVDIRPLLEGRTDTLNRYLFWGYEKQGVVRTSKWKYVLDDKKEFLFDITIDPQEQANVRDFYSDVSSSLKRKLLEWPYYGLPDLSRTLG